MILSYCIYKELEQEVRFEWYQSYVHGALPGLL